MLTVKRQRKYIDRLFDKMQMSLKSFCHNKDPEELHQFRVSIKKLFGFLKLYPHTRKQKKSKEHILSLKEIFKHAGIIRSGHIHLQLMEKYKNTNRAIIQHQQQDINDQITRFELKLIRYKNSIREDRKYIIHHLCDLKKGSLLGFYKKKIKELNIFFKNKTFDMDQLHRERKKIKILIYNYKVLPKKLTGIIRMNTEYLARLETIIGEYHDTLSILELLNTNQLASKPTQHKLQAQIEKLIRQIHIESSDFSKKANL